MMMWLKSCPRCHGDLLLDSDYYGPSVSCIQCGHTLQEPLSGVRPSRLADKPAAPMPMAAIALSLSACDRKVRVA
jgi:hypothetical protein